MNGEPAILNSRHHEPARDMQNRETKPASRIAPSSRAVERQGSSPSGSQLLLFMQSYMLKVLRVGDPCPSMRMQINAPVLVQRYWNRVVKKQPWFDESKEHLVVLLLSTKLCVEGYSLVSIGSLNESIAHPREIFRAAVAGGAYGIILIHNHPSGYPEPSACDVDLTRRLAGAADLLQIKLLDHVIIGRPNPQLLEPDLMHTSTRLTRKARKACEASRISRQGYYSFKEAFAL